MASDLRWIGIVDLSEKRGESIRDSIRKWLPPSRLHAFRSQTGLDPLAVTKLVVARFERSTLYLIETHDNAQQVQNQFKNSYIVDATTTAYQPDASCISGRTDYGVMQAVCALGANTVVIEHGGHRQAQIAALAALGRLKRTPRVFDLGDMRFAASMLPERGVRWFALAPFEQPWDKALHGLAAASSVVAIGAYACEDSCQAIVSERTKKPANALLLRTRLVGSWGADAPRASQLLQASWQDLEQSHLGRVLGLNEPLQATHIHVQDSAIGLDVTVDLDQILQGLYHLLAAESAEILAFVPSSFPHFLRCLTANVPDTYVASVKFKEPQ